MCDAQNRSCESCFKSWTEQLETSVLAMYSNGGKSCNTLDLVEDLQTRMSLGAMFIEQKRFQQLLPKCTSNNRCNMQLDEVEWDIHVAVPRPDLVHDQSVPENIAAREDQHGRKAGAYLNQARLHQASTKACRTSKRGHELNHSDSSSSVEERLCDLSVQMRPSRFGISGICTHECLYEHLFYKIVTPSDVGKLNRLVIPKQNAERYFPLHPSYRKRGLLLCFRDHNIASGKLWWFRYSYWSSSQSYVLTKGWIRFVKDKNLKAGDIISFERGITHDEFYISCRRRPSRVHDAAVPGHHEAQATNSSTHYSTADVVSTGSVHDLPGKLKLPEALPRELYTCRSEYRSDVQREYTSCKGRHESTWTKASSLTMRPWEGNGDVNMNRVADPLNSISEMRLFGVDLKFHTPSSTPKS